MSDRKDKQRIVALQKALRIAKKAMEEAQCQGTFQGLDDALYEIGKLDWNSKPDLIQDRSRRA